MSSVPTNHGSHDPHELLAPLREHLMQCMGECPSRVVSIPAGYLATFFSNRLVSVPHVDDAPIDDILKSVETVWANKLVPTHWSLIRSATEKHARYFLHSRNFFAWSNCITEADQFTASFAPRSFEEAVSLGTYCQTAHTLRLLGVRKRSGPFDWVFFNLPALVHALDDDFQIFMDPVYFKPVPPSQRPVSEACRCHHDYYRNNFGIQFVFNHHDLTIPDDFAHYQRAVSGFRSAFTHSHAVLFVLMTLSDCSESQLGALSDAMRRRGGQQHTVVMRIRKVEPEFAARSPPSVTWRSDNLIACDFFAGSGTDGVQFNDPVDNNRLIAWMQAVFIKPSAMAVTTQRQG